VGLGTAAAVQERGNAYIIGVDTDWTVSASEYANVTLTSVLKRLEVTTQQAIAAVAAGNFQGGLQVATLANGGVGIAPIRNVDQATITRLTAEAEQLAQAIINGTITVHSFATLP
jgi:basic membrane protein A